VKVVSCSTAQAGTVPYMLMADLGADVIKIETPNGGDTSRVASVLPGMPSAFFETNNRGVKSVTLDLKQPAAREILIGLSPEPTSSARTFGRVRPRRMDSAGMN
jgi:crotonobetainyl-CoA:carnitine CoA-transferase CaiB-like acyl-CoA transferase